MLDEKSHLNPIEYFFDDINDVESSQYVWGAHASGVSAKDVRGMVKKWIFNAPLKYLPSCCYSGVLDFFDNLKHRKIATAIFSDYPAKDKLAALGLLTDNIFCSTDKNIDRLKPNPKGLFFIVEALGVLVDQCLFIGNRDGECARRAGMPYLILNKKIDGDNQFQTYHVFNQQLEEYS